MAQPIVISRTPDYSDLDLDFIAHPTTKDVVVKTGADAIKRSVRNLILTNFYEKPFRPGIGSSAVKLLFDNMSPLVSNFLENAIAEVIQNYEPRVQLVNVTVEPDYDNNGYTARLDFIVLNRNEPLTTTIFLERVR
jgi:phage baseplate assembly protein W